MLKKWNWYELFLLVALLGMAICCAVFLADYWSKTCTAKQEFLKLSEIMHTNNNPLADEEDSSNISALREKNSDCIGWLQSADMEIDYPIMHTPNQPEYYLRRNFSKHYSIAGTPFVDAGCDIFGSLNVIIHGHNMKDGSMFASLEKYQDKQYGLDHSQFTLYLENEVRKYNLMAVLHFELTPENINQYYKIPESRVEFENYVDFLEEKSLYCGGYSATWGDQLLTLSTCDNKTENGRILVVAKEL